MTDIFTVTVQRDGWTAELDPDQFDSTDLGHLAAVVRAAKEAR